MLEIISILSLSGALALLAALTVIDLKHHLLPNELVMGLAALGMVFHLTTMNTYLSIEHMAIGALFGFISLFGVRVLANWYYQDDALGLGDVKLMTAAGLWLGPYYIFLALGAGAMAGVLHGLGLALLAATRTGKMPNLNTLALPAGPGFAAGIIIAAIAMIATNVEAILP